MKTWTEAELTRHGVTLADEGMHSFAPDDVAWNESIFFDWIDQGGALAGHCRIGRHPGLGHLWVWVYLYDGHQWLALNEPMLPLSEAATETWDYEGDELAFSWEVKTPLALSTLHLKGVGRVSDGPNEGSELPFEVTLTFRAAGPAHGMAARKVKGKDGETYMAGRYEQPCDVSGHVSLGGQVSPIEGRGERDHSWGPRHWAMQWLFLVLEGEHLRAQCTEVLIGGAMRICVGYVQDEAMHAVSDTRFELEFADESNVHVPFQGSVSVRYEEGSLAGRLVCLSGVALDDGHCLPKGVRSIYRRNLVRFEPEGGGEPILGWMETHRLVMPQ